MHLTKRKSERLPQEVSSWIALGVALLVGIGSVLANPVDRWDGFAHDVLSQSSHRLGLEFYISQTGLHLLGPVIAALGTLSDIFDVTYWRVARVLLASCLIGIGFETYRLARDAFEFTSAQSRWAAAMALGSPAFLALQSSGQIYAVFIWAAFVGHRLISQPAGSIQSKAIGWILILASFQLNANLVFVLGLESVRWIVRTQNFSRSIHRAAALIATTIVAYVVLRHVAGPKGLWAMHGYNNFLWPTSVDAVKKLARSIALWSGWLLLPAIALFVTALNPMRFLRGSTREFSTGNPSLETRRCMGALILAAAAIFPYIVVGKHSTFLVPLLPALSNSVYLSFMAEYAPAPLIDGFRAQNIRHAMMLGGPLSLLCVACVAWVVEKTGAGARASTWGLAFTTAHILAWGAYAHSLSLRQGLIDEQVVQALRSTPPPIDGALVVMQRRQLPVFWYGSSESNALLYQAYGRTAWRAVTVFGINSQPFATLISYSTGSTLALAGLSVNDHRAYKQFALMENYQQIPCIEALNIDVESVSFFQLASNLLGRRDPPTVKITDRARTCGPELASIVLP